MTFRDDSKLDPSQVQDARGGGYAGPLIVGGGGIGLLILIASLLLGVDPYAGNDPAAGPLEGAPSIQECRTGADANRRADCRIVGFVDSIQKYWTDEFDRRGDTYLPATTVIYTGSVAAGCGIASGAAGPFYCPTDGKVYLDLSFFDDLQTRFGARGGPFAEAYVVAHEYGHHVQDLLGLLERGGGQRGPRSGSVRVELQADCLAGVWARHAADTGYLQPASDAQIAQALDAAAAVGDDRIQRETSGRVAPEQWTHGSSAQRQQWFRTGYQTGDLDKCDTSSL
jgi:predicted metalloprotease